MRISIAHNDDGFIYDFLCASKKKQHNFPSISSIPAAVGFNDSIGCVNDYIMGSLAHGSAYIAFANRTGFTIVIITCSVWKT